MKQKIYYLIVFCLCMAMVTAVYAELSGDTTQTSPNYLPHTPVDYPNSDSFSIVDPDSLDITGINAVSFPNILSYVTVNTPSGTSGTLTKDDFIVKEDGVSQTITSFAYSGGGTSTKLDLAIVFDDTGSMGYTIADMQAKVTELTDSISAAGIDCRYSLISFKDGVTLRQGWTSDPTTIKNAVNGLIADGGDDAPEVDLDAIESALALSWRADAQRMMLDITDAPTHYRGDGTSFSSYTIDETTNHLLANGITYILVGPSTYSWTTLTSSNDKRYIVNGLGGNGLFIDIASADFSTILEKITDLITQTYTIGYSTTNLAQDGSQRVVQISVGSKSDSGIYLAPLVTTPRTITGKVIDSTTGLGVPGATVSIAGLSTISDSDGAYSITGIPDGTLKADFTGSPLSGHVPLDVSFSDLSEDNVNTLIATKTGYNDFSNSHIKIDAGATLTYDIPLTPVGAENVYRIVLTWGSNPRDLDSHLITPAIEGTSHHICWHNKGNLLSSPYAVLDLDNTAYYGPETVTIQQSFAGTYSYFVHDYSNMGGNGEISSSGAQINLYKGATLLRTFNAPSSGTGTYWQVFNFDGATGTITPINVISTTPQVEVSGEIPSGDKETTSSKQNYCPTELSSSTTAAIISWLWSFGDGTTSTEQNPTHRYTTTGYKTVSLTVSTGSSENTEIKSNLIDVSGVTITPPTITDIKPASGQQGGAYQVTINGANFETDASTVTVSGTGVSVGTYISRTNTQIKVPFKISTGAATGVRTVTVTNPSSLYSATGTFMVTAGPKITRITPTSGQQGGIYSVTIYGKNFEKNKSKVKVSGEGVKISSYSIQSTNKIKVKFTISPDAVAGKRTVTVTNPVKGGTGTSKFTITTGPKITSITPHVGVKNSKYTVTIAGRYFEKNRSKVSISGTGVTIESYKARTDKKIAFRLKISNKAKVGPRTVIVTNPIGGGTDSGRFTIRARSDTVNSTENTVVIKPSTKAVTNSLSGSSATKAPVSGGVVVPISAPVFSPGV